MDSSRTASETSPKFRELDDLLKCGVCHETMTTPVLTPCSHSYCSLCIRKWLNTKQICPTCSVEVYENSLRKNPIIQNIIEAVQRLKERFSEKILDRNLNDKQQIHVSTPSSSKEYQAAEISYHHNKSDKDVMKPSLLPKSDTPKSKSLHGNGILSTPKSRSIKKIVNSDSDDEDADFEPKLSSRKIQVSKGNGQNVLGSLQTTPRTPKSPAPARVACPVCSVTYLERFINDHLDKCLFGEGAVSTRSANNASNTSNTTVINRSTTVMPSPSTSRPTQTSVKSSFSVERISQPLKHIKKMVYNLMSDSQLKKELRKYGLPVQGDRRTLQSRLQRWVVMHNAECDSNHPRSIEELRKQFEKDEKALTGHPSTSLSQIFKSKQPDTEDFESERKGYIKQNDESYKTLINQIKSRRNMNASLPMKVDSEDESSKIRFQEEKTSVKDLSKHINEEKKNGEDEGNATKAVHAEDVQVISDDEEYCVKKVVKRHINYVESEDSEEEALKPVKTNLKRKGKFIEDSESETDEETRRPLNKKAAVKKASSPVLATGSNVVRRQLRSRSQQSGEQGKQTRPQRKEPSIPENKKIQKKPLKKTAVKEQQEPSLVDDSSVNSKRSSIKTAAKEIEDSQYADDDTDLFVSPASSEIPCGQKLKSNLGESGGEDSRDAVSQLVSLMEDQSSGSSTDFE